MTMFGLCRNCCESCKEWFRCHECCKCVPKWICVTVEAAGGCSFTTKTMMFVLSVDTENPTYEGTVGCGTLSVDLTFTFEMDEGTCKAFLESTCLGLTGINRLSQNIAIGHCLMEGDSLVFNADSTVGCGDLDCDALTITIEPSDVVLSPVSCCECLPRCLCATVIVDGESGDAEICWDAGEEAWIGTVSVCGNVASVEARLTENEYGICQIEATVGYGEDEDTVISEIIDGGCATGRMVFEEDYALTLGALSGTLCLVTRQCKCSLYPCDGPAPCTLYVTVVTDCDTEEFELTLNARACSDDRWVWEGSGGSLSCNIDILGYPTCTAQGTVNVRLTLTNDGCPTWSLLVTAGSCEAEVSGVSVACDPIQIDVTTDFNCSCLDDVQVTITE
jgi:hypothetical protein